MVNLLYDISDQIKLTQGKIYGFPFRTAEILKIPINKYSEWRLNLFVCEYAIRDIFQKCGKCCGFLPDKPLIRVVRTLF